MIEERIYPDPDLPADLRCQVLSFLRVTWPDGFSGENQLRDWITRAEHHPLHFVLFERRILISHLEVVWKHLDHAGETYKAYGLTGVFTYPAFRGRGFGRRLVAAATAYVDASDADVGIFHCAPGLRDFYGACGWTPLDRATTLKGDPARPRRSDELLMMRFVSEKGRRAREAFENVPLYFGEDTW